MANLFKTFNYTGVPSLVSFTLPFTEFIFKPSFNIDGALSNTRVLWDFGDGTSSEALTGRHSYYLPGIYNVTCHFYDRFGNTSTDTESVTAYNFISNKLTASAESSDPIVVSSKIGTPITLSRFTSYQSAQDDSILTIIPFASGTNDNFFDTGISDAYYGHLYPFSSFYQLQPVTKDTSEFVEISSFTTSNEKLYFKLNGTTIQRCKSTDSGSFFCGTSGTAVVFYKSDKVLPAVDLFFGLESGSLLTASNTYNTILSGIPIIPNNRFDHLSITSCGLEAEGGSVRSYDISKNKFANTKIGFVVKLKDDEDFTIKRPIEVISDFQFSLRDSNNNIYPGAIFETNTQQLSTDLLYNIYRGTLTVSSDLLTAGSLNNVYIHSEYTIKYIPNYLTYQSNYLTLSSQVLGYYDASSTPTSGTVVDSLTSITISLSGNSSSFNIYPEKGLYTIAKINEDIDMTEKFKEISLQSLFLDNPVLYDQFLGSIFGTISSSQTSIGKLTYEKIANFISNNKILDYANINSLYSLFEEYNVDTLKFSENNFRYPAELSRLIDILSINKSRLFGSKECYNEDFDTRGYIDSELYGKNLGDEITIYQTISAGEGIIAYERFGNVLKVVNTYQPVEIVGSNVYPISAYKETWGWGLVLPSDGFGDRIRNYYTFYRHITSIEGTVKDSIINFSDASNTLPYELASYEEWSKRDGIISNLISNQLYKGLNLFDKPEIVIPTVVVEDESGFGYLESENLSGAPLFFQ